jgi:hypothetical protein
LEEQPLGEIESEVVRRQLDSALSWWRRLTAGRLSPNREKRVTEKTVTKLSFQFESLVGRKQLYLRIV